MMADRARRVALEKVCFKFLKEIFKKIYQGYKLALFSNIRENRAKIATLGKFF